MFTGIIETMGTVSAIMKDGNNMHFWIQSTLQNELRIDQSVSHNGVCLTIVELKEDQHCVTAIDETLLRSSIGLLKVGDKVNLERCMLANGRYDGHMVQGHVDQTAKCLSIDEHGGSWHFRFQLSDADHIGLIVEKGSICVNGISLTVVNCSASEFEVAIIPYTYENTNLHAVRVGGTVNIEFDILGKYIARQLSMRA